ARPEARERTGSGRRFPAPRRWAPRRAPSRSPRRMTRRRRCRAKDGCAATYFRAGWWSLSLDGRWNDGKADDRVHNREREQQAGPRQSPDRVARERGARASRGGDQLWDEHRQREDRNERGARAQAKREHDIDDHDPREGGPAEQHDHDEMERKRDHKVEKHDREEAPDCGHQKEDEREREDLSAEERIPATGQRDESFERIVLELAIERAHRRKDRRERQREPEERRGDVWVARGHRSDHETLEKDEHRDERHRRDDAVGLSSLGAELATGDESDAQDHAAVAAPSSIATCAFASSSSSGCACVAMTSARPSSRARPIVCRKRFTPASSRSAKGSSRSRSGTRSVST